MKTYSKPQILFVSTEGCVLPEKSSNPNAKCPEKEKIKKKAMKAWLGVLIKLIVVTALVWALFTFVFGLTITRGTSMAPSINDGDLILYYRLQSSYSVGEVVLYEVNDEIYTGRIIARAGDIVNIADEGGLSVNGASRYEQNIYYDTFRDGSLVSFPLTVENNSYFILGDHRTSAHDSREFGCISEDDILGVVSAQLRRRGF